MSNPEQLLLSVSLLANGNWLASRLISRSQSSAEYLGRTALILFGLSLVLIAPDFVWSTHNFWVQLSKALSTIMVGACVPCFSEWARLQPAPWGMGPRRKKARAR